MEKGIAPKLTLFRNPELKATLTILVLIQLCFVLIFFLFENRLINSINKEIIEQNISLVGRLTMLQESNVIDFKETTNDELTSKFADIITKGGTQQDYEIGTKLLNQYGYKSDLSISYQGAFRRVLASHSIKLAVLFFGSILLVVLIVCMGYSQLYKKVANIVTASERVLSDSFDIRLDEAGEGELALLGSRFNQMVRKLEYTLESLKTEKLNLKNIISDISHQIKTPLSSLILFNELMLNEKNKYSNNEENGDKTTSFIYESKKQLERMEWLVISLLKMARLEAGAIEFNRKRLPIIIPVKNTIELLKYKIKEKQIEVRIIPENESNICAVIDKEWLTEAFINILKNCIEHTSEKGLIEIKLQETPLFSKVIIKDNGEGISRKDLPHIFKRFYKGENSVLPQSIGIGLALTRAIIEGNGGDIRVKSKQWEGTSFTITFHK